MFVIRMNGLISLQRDGATNLYYVVVGDERSPSFAQYADAVRAYQAAKFAPANVKATGFNIHGE
jgi:hypothetical protein